jgi:hypothetical protein
MQIRTTDKLLPPASQWLATDRIFLHIEEQMMRIYLATGLYMALWGAAGRPSRVRAFRDFLQARERQRRA